MSICSIYIIKNIINNKVYVGQTWQSIKRRFAAHLQRNTANHCIKLRRAIDKYNKENFYIELLEICTSQEEADNKEIAFIKKFDSVKNGYNILEYAFSRKGIKHSEKTKKYMSQTRKGAGNGNCRLNQFQVNLIREEYKNYTNPNTGTKYGALTKIAKKYNVGISTISEIINEQAWL